MDYNKVEISDNTRYEQYLRSCKQISSDVTTCTIYGYANQLSTKRAYSDGFCWQRAIYRGKEAYYPPVGDWEKPNWSEILSKNVQPGAIFIGIPEYLMNIWISQINDYIEYHEERKEFDYLYDIDRQVKAVGKKYSEIRRTEKFFMRSYNYEVLPVTVDVLPELLHIQSKFISQHEVGYEFAEDMKEEDLAFKRILSHWDEFTNVHGLCVKVDNRMSGFIIWEVIDSENVVALFSKGEREYKYISEFLYAQYYREVSKSDLKISNIMSDMGISSLRATKERKNPISLLKKYNVIWKPSVK